MKNNKKFNKIMLIVLAVLILILIVIVAASKSVTAGEVIMDATIQEADIMNGFGTEKIGTRGYIEISQDTFDELTADDFLNFANERVKDSGYNWFSILVKGKEYGAQWQGSIIDCVIIGTLDSDGVYTGDSDTLMKYYTLSDGKYIDETEKYIADSTEFE